MLLAKGSRAGASGLLHRPVSPFPKGAAMPRLPLLTLAGWLLLVPAVGAAAPDPKAPDTRADNARRQDLARLLQQAVVAAVPKQFEDLGEWNKSVPIPDRLTLSKNRKRIIVDGREELPHGAWRRTKVWLADPARDVKVEVPQAKKIDA